MNEQLKVRHLGSRWSLPQDAADDNKVLRACFRLGSNTGLGKLANWCGWTVKDQPFIDAVKRLSDFGMVLVESNRVREGLLVTLTAEGRAWGLEVTCKEQEVQPHHVAGSEAAEHAAKCAEKYGFKK